MKIGVAYLKRAVVIGSLLAFLQVPSLAEAIPALVQTVANPGNADAGESGALAPNLQFVSAQITVVVINPLDGTPVDEPGVNVGTGAGGIALPPGWTLRQGFSVPPFGCLMTPTQFLRQGNGIYTISVVPFVGNSSCTWLPGDYHYVVEINITVGGNTFQGSGLGVLFIE